MAQQFRTLQAAQKDADLYQTALALSVAHLFKASLVPTGSTTKDELEAAEADYDTYATKTLTAWNEPILSPGSGYMVGSPLVQWDVGTTDPVEGNVIGGVWVEDAAGTVRQVYIFDEPVPMQLAGQGIPWNMFVLFPAGN